MVCRDTERVNPSRLDNAILREMYIEYNTPCDSLIRNPANLQSFAKDYAQRTGQRAEPARISHRLLALRKFGQAKAGLPRLQRKPWASRTSGCVCRRR